MATVVAVMDRPGWAARTDNIVVVDGASRSLRWIPRDLWCAGIGDRINTAYARGGLAGLSAALAEHGIVVDHGVCLARAAVEHALDGVEVTVPVPADLAFWYPITPGEPIEHGRKVVEFRAPSETLRGERIHQWIGARLAVGGGSSDLDRIARQQTLLRCLTDDDFAFGRVLDDPALVVVSSPAALDEIGRATSAWSFATFTDVVPRRVAGMAVLVNRHHVSRVRARWWRMRAHLSAVRARLRRVVRRASS